MAAAIIVLFIDKGKKKMVILTGKSVFEGIVIGRISFYKRNDIVVKQYQPENIEEETARFFSAKGKAQEELQRLYEKAVDDIGEANAMMFWVHKMILEDSNYIQSVTEVIDRKNTNAEQAVIEAREKFAGMFASMEDAYMKGRAADVKDVSERLLHILCAGHYHPATIEEPAIIASDDFSPSEAIQFEKEKVLSFITAHGSTNSHTAILARTRNIPAVFGLGAELKKECDQKYAIVDGLEGKVYIDPDEKTLMLMRKRQTAYQEQKELLQKLKGKENRTRCGQKIEINANISKIADIEEVIKNDAGGIGLFRSEFLYLKNDDFPTEQQQFDAYKEAALKMCGKKVVIRTMDIGADKQAAYFSLDKEENPAMGYRAIRICLKQPDIFKTQLRALYRASVFGNIAIIVPMIIAVSEVRAVKRIICEVKQELMEEGKAFDTGVKLGIMIETPAAALISRALAKEVDFFSMGTNDLSQYTLAIDRTNEKLDSFFDACHPAVLELISIASKSAQEAGIPIGICGELAADLSLTETFLEMGIDELSVAPSMVLPLRKRVRQL